MDPDVMYEVETLNQRGKVVDTMDGFSSLRTAQIYAEETGSPKRILRVTRECVLTVGGKSTTQQEGSDG